MPEGVIDVRNPRELAQCRKALDRYGSYTDAEEHGCEDKELNRQQPRV